MRTCFCHVWFGLVWFEKQDEDEVLRLFLRRVNQLQINSCRSAAGLLGSWLYICTLRILGMVCIFCIAGIVGMVIFTVDLGDMEQIVQIWLSCVQLVQLVQVWQDLFKVWFGLVFLLNYSKTWLGELCISMLSMISMLSKYVQQFYVEYTAGGYLARGCVRLKPRKSRPMSGSCFSQMGG